MIGYEALCEGLCRAYPLLEAKLIRRLARSYGTRTTTLLGEVRVFADLGPHFGADLSGREVDYLMAEEWAVSAADVLWRRSKLGLRVTDADKARLAAYMAERPEVREAQ